MTMPPLPMPYYPAARIGMPTQQAYIAADMRAYGDACVAAEREHLLAELRRMHTEAGGMHNYYLFAVRQLEREPNGPVKRGRPASA